MTSGLTAHGLDPSGERKLVTVLFADVSRSMDLAESLDPEDWAEVMGEFFGILSDGVTRFGGMVDKFTGDGIMALFGAPVAQEDHARRACHTALYLETAIAPYAAELREAKGIDLSVRLGLNSGEVVVGSIGDGSQVEYTAIGHTVGLAQRMESLAEPGCAFLTENTARLVRDHFVLRDLGPIAVKGASEPVGVFALEAAMRPSPRVAATGFVGRMAELQALEAALAGAGGHLQLVDVVGEAGVGKSRLCEQLVQGALARGMTVHRAAGISHAHDIPLLPVLELFRNYFGVSETVSPDRAADRIAERVLAASPSQGEAVSLLFDFFSIPDPDRPTEVVAAEVRIARILALLAQVIGSETARQTLVLLIEDVHWFDPQSLAFLERLIPLCAETRTLVLTTFRPEYFPPWTDLPYHHQVSLPPLDATSTGQLLDEVLGRDASLTGLAGRIATRTGGNPFFVEEAVRSLVDGGALEGIPGAYRLVRSADDLRVPATVQGTLAARIDRLPEREKALLQTAAVIGRSFTKLVLQVVSGIPADELTTSLDRLLAAEFLEDTSAEGTQEHRFVHALTQEVAYDSMLRRRRTALHARAAEAIIGTEPQRLDERSAVIAFHYERADDRLEAARWNERAGAWAVRSDVGEAIRRWEATIRHLDASAETEEALLLGVQVRSRLIRYGARTGMAPDEIDRLSAEGRALAVRTGASPPMVAMALAQATALWQLGSTGKAVDYAIDATRLAEGGDAGFAAAAHLFVGIARCATGPVPAGIEAIGRVRALCAADASTGQRVLGYRPLARSHAFLAQLLALDGRFEEAYREADRAVARCREDSDSEGIAWSLSIYPRLARSMNEAKEALARSEEARHIAERSGNPFVGALALGAVGAAQLALGRFAGAVSTLEQALAESRRQRLALSEETTLLIHLARAQIGRGNGPAAGQVADEAIEAARRQVVPVVECLALLTRASVQQAVGAPETAVFADLRSARTLARAVGARAYEAAIEQQGRQLTGWASPEV